MALCCAGLSLASQVLGGAIGASFVVPRAGWEPVGNAEAAIHATGAQVTAGAFTLMVAYEGYETPSDPASHDGFLYLTDPQGLLFDLVANTQDRFADLARVAAYYEIAVNFPDPEDPGAGGLIYVNTLVAGEVTPVREVAFTILSRKLLREVICAVWPIADCRVAQRRGPKVETFLYRAKGTHPPRVFPKVPNLVLFGALPDPEMSGVYVLRPELGQEQNYTRLRLRPAGMARHFQPLER